MTSPTGHRPEHRPELRPELRLGLDIGGTKTHGVLLDADGTVLREQRRPTRPGEDGVVSTVLDLVGELTLELAGDRPATHLGIGIPGLIDPAAGTVGHAVNLGIASPFPLADRVRDGVARRGTDVAVTLENDVNAATLGAAAVLGVDDLALISIGTGVAAGLLLEGRLRRGPRGAAGEIGHLTLDPAGPRCECGQRGCLELYAAGSTLSTALTEILAEERHAAERARFLGAVTTAVRVLVQTVEPAVVVLAGGVASVGDPLLDAVRAELTAQSAASGFLASLHLPDRIRLVPDEVPVAAVGAALLGSDA